MPDAWFLIINTCAALAMAIIFWQILVAIKPIIEKLTTSMLENQKATTAATATLAEQYKGLAAAIERIAGVNQEQSTTIAAMTTAVQRVGTTASETHTEMLERFDEVDESQAQIIAKVDEGQSQVVASLQAAVGLLNQIGTDIKKMEATPRKPYATREDLQKMVEQIKQEITQAIQALAAPPKVSDNQPAIG